MKKLFEFITFEEFKRIAEISKTWVDQAARINNLLNGKAQWGYTTTDKLKEGDICDIVSANAESKYDTHQALVFLREIEEEKPDCACEPKRTKMTRNPQDDGRVILAYCEVDNKFCPECGKKIEGVE